jgi:monoamine oxidase
MSSFTRRDALKLAGTTLAVGTLAPHMLAAATPARRPKKVIVGGAGIAGLCCAFELMQRGHDVTVLEASPRAGGHVLSSHEFGGGLYADLGAEQCTEPGYELYRGYAKQLGLTLLPYRRRDHVTFYIEGKPFTDEQLTDRNVLAGFGLSAREIDFVCAHEFKDLKLLYFGPYLDKFPDEYQPFGVGLDDLDHVSVPDFLRKEGASAAAIKFAGRGSVSALFDMWYLAGLRHRRRPLFPRNLHRIAGGNQRLTDAFAARLGDRVKVRAPITRLEHGQSGVTAYYRELGSEQKLSADYFVNAIALPIFKKIPVTPDWPAQKKWVMENTSYDMQTRVVFVCRTRFWKDEGISVNISPGQSALLHVWECANEVPGTRGILLGEAHPGTTPEQALEVFRRHYPGKSIDIEKVIVKDWFKETWAPLCERTPFPLGQLAKFWPHILQPHGRIHFCGAYADNTTGMEAATRSAHRVAREIDAA